MKEFNKGRVLILPDWHQDLKFLHACLELNFDYVVFLGDDFDTFKEPDGVNISGFTQTCDTVNWLFDKYKDIGCFLAGNHNLAYFATYNKDYIKTRPNEDYLCSGWTKKKATTFNKVINPAVMEGTELCCKVGDYIVSHAGFHWNHFNPMRSEIDNIKNLYNHWEQTKMEFSRFPGHWIWDVGQCRGGHHSIGSPVWLDWHFEFQPLDGVKQIVGHTTRLVDYIRCKKNHLGLENYIVDNMQSACMIWEDGKTIFLNPFTNKELEIEQ